ncbi:MHC class II transactivator [Pelodytes ibericus]
MSVMDSTFMGLLQSDLELDMKDIEKCIESVFEFEDKSISLNEDCEDYDTFAGIVQYIVHDKADNQLEKILAERMKKVIPLVIHLDQIGFVPGRISANNTKRMSDILEKVNRSGAPLLSLSLDAEKTFDRIGWSFLGGVLRAFGGLEIRGHYGLIFLPIRLNVTDNPANEATRDSSKSRTRSGRKRLPCIPLEKCLTADSKAMPLSPTFSPQQMISFAITPGSNIIIYAGVWENAQNKSIPETPDRNCSSSPFAPADADLPNLPEETSKSHCHPVDIAANSQQSQVISEPLQKEKDPGHMYEFKAMLMEQYNAHLSLGTDVIPVDITLVNSKIDIKTGKLASKSAEKDLMIYDMAEQERETVQLRNIFEDKLRKEMDTKIIALIGQSGMGKSVLAKKICQKWSAGEFAQFSLVFYFDCSKLNLCKKQYSLKQFLFELCSCPQTQNIEIYQYILRNPEKMLLIFDGFDEFKEPEGFTLGIYMASPSKRHTAKELFTGIFQKKLLRGCTMLITARPKEKFHQYLTKVDQIIEMTGLSSQQVEWYINEYFKKSPEVTDILKFIKDYQYLFSYCYIPFFCRHMCLFAADNFKTRKSDVHMSLAAFFLNIIQNKQLRSSGLTSPNTTNLEHTSVQSDSFDLELGSKHQNVSTDSRMCSTEQVTRKYGFPNLGPKNTGTIFQTLSSNSLIQHFQTAQNLMESKERNFVKCVCLKLPKKKNQEMCPDLVRRCFVGLLFYEDLKLGKGLLRMIPTKQRKMCDYLREVRLSDLCPQRQLELCHCVYETNDASLIQHTALKFRDELSFAGTRLAPPDVHVLKHILKKCKSKLSLDVRKTGIDQKGLRELMGLKNIKYFRASLHDTISLWNLLQAEKSYKLLKLCVKKFTIEPFKAKSKKDISDFLSLVNIQDSTFICDQDSTNFIAGIPAVKNLQKILFGLGKKHGQEGFLMLVDIFPKLPELKHLDLNNFCENHIGDKGVERLAEKFPEMQSLETLDLSENNITDAGARNLANALPSLTTLKTLSLYNNYISDTGAQHLADILPKMTSLEELHLQCNRITDVGARKLTDSLHKCPKMKSLAMYSMSIPHAILQHLQQQDSRISCMSIG